jgi:uncharacterized protein (TIGR03083 family)
MPTDPGLDRLLPALARSHDRLVAAVEPLDAEELAGPSYDDDWSIAQVLSHLGSGAEIFLLMIDAGLNGTEAPGVEEFRPVWDRWNAMSAEQQATEALLVDAAFLERLGSVPEVDRTRWRMALFGADTRLADLARMRLGEHALHTWDVVVALEPDATVASDAVDLLIDRIGDLVARVGKSDQSMRVHVTTHGPDRTFLLEIEPASASLSPAGPLADVPASIRLPAEAFVRLVYGRLDPDHTTDLSTDGVDVDDLRRAFPGL